MRPEGKLLLPKLERQTMQKLQLARTKTKTETPEPKTSVGTSTGDRETWTVIEEWLEAQDGTSQKAKNSRGMQL